MKKLKMMFSAVLAFVLVLTLASPAFALSNEGATTLSEYDQLKADIAIIENVELSELQEFQQENAEWIEEVNARIEAYLETIPAEERDSTLIELRGDNPNARSAYDYFDSYKYHLRGEYYTYTMTPKMSTRLLRSYAEAGWDELSSIYYYIRNDTGSLYWQYMCHFDLFVESEWDIERGVPEVSSYAAMIAALCNPQNNDGYVD